MWKLIDRCLSVATPMLGNRLMAGRIRHRANDTRARCREDGVGELLGPAVCHGRITVEQDHQFTCRCCQALVRSQRITTGVVASVQLDPGRTRSKLCEVARSRLLRPVVDDDESLAIVSPCATNGFQALPDYAKSVVHADDDVDPAVSLRRNPLLPDLCIRRPRIGIHDRALKGIDQLLRRSGRGIVRHEDKSWVVACTLWPLREPVPRDARLLESIIHAQLISLAVTVDLSPPNVEKRSGPLIWQTEHHQVGLDQIGMVEARGTIAGHLSAHRLGVIYILALEASLQLFIDRCPSWMRDCRDGALRRYESCDHGINVT